MLRSQWQSLLTCICQLCEVPSGFNVPAIPSNAVAEFLRNSTVHYDIKDNV